MTYRLIYLTLDPLTPSVVTLGALLNLTSIGVVPMLPPTLPPLPSELRRLAAEGLQARILKLATFDSLPPVFGPYVHLGPIGDIPADVDAEAYVGALLRV